MGGAEPRLGGRLDPAEMFPAGSAHVRARMVTLPSGMQLRVAEAGVHAGVPVLLVHGWGASLYMWRDWFAHFAVAGRYVLAVDLPGHGLSDKPDDDDVYRLESLTRILRELIAEEGHSCVDLVAQSMGGTIGLEVALAADGLVRRAVLVNPACFGRVRLQRLFPLAGQSAADVILPRLVRRWIVARTHRLQFHDPSAITSRDEDEYWAPSQFPAFARAMRRLVHVFQWTRAPAEALAKRLRVSGVPVMAVLGRKDGLVRDAFPYVESLNREGARVETRVIEAGAHAVNEERPAEVAAHALAFLRGS